MNDSSFLEKLGGGELKKDMRTTGRLIRWLLRLVIFPKRFLRKAERDSELWNSRRVKIIRRWGRIFFPFRLSYKSDIKFSDGGKIIVINHPSLTDPITTLIWAVLAFPSKPILIPVNLPWFEEFGEYVELLGKIGIVLVPMLTPKTLKRLKPYQTPEQIDEASRLKAKLERSYFREMVKLADNGGISIIPQSATRQRTLWLDGQQWLTGVSADGRKPVPTVSMAALEAKHSKISSSVEFVIIGVVLPRWCFWGFGKLNLFTPYQLNIGEVVPILELREREGPRLDSWVLRAMEKLVPESYWC
jgi:hypothetical protein